MIDSFLWSTGPYLGQVVADFEEVIVLPAIFGAIGAILWLATLSNPLSANAKKLRAAAYTCLGLALVMGLRFTLKLTDGFYMTMIDSRRVLAAHWAAGLAPLVGILIFAAIDFFTLKRARRRMPGTTDPLGG